MTAVAEDLDLSLSWVTFTADDHGKPCEGSKHKPKGCGLEAVAVAVWDVACDHVGPESYHCANHRDEIVAFAASAIAIVCAACNTPVRLLRIEPIR